MNKLPNQPLHLDKQGCLRFVENPIVRYLLDNGGIDLNHLRALCEVNGIDDEYQAQFAQLIGYSHYGWGTLSYVTAEKWNSVDTSNKVDLP